MAKRQLDMGIASELVDSTRELSHSPPQLKRARFSINDLLLQTEQKQSNSPKANSVDQPDDEYTEEDSRRTSTPVSSTTNGDLSDECVAQTVPNWAPIGQSLSLTNVDCQLEGRDLWARFYKLGTEMIITKVFI
ncbi:hypothetical protein M3Y97_00500400 [Aphelenchoides bicaudatus]|nr:hypothetical protein M3Y97_00500400 [Aphelenchoides bicaudatus]